MTTNNTMSAKAKKIAARKELSQLRKYLDRDNLSKQEDLNDNLVLFPYHSTDLEWYEYDPAVSEDLIKTQQRITRLLIEAGADPNCANRFKEESVFEAFIRMKKPYCAIEVAKADNFVPPKNMNKLFGQLYDSVIDYLSYDSDPHKILVPHIKGLMRTLLDKGIAPTDDELRFQVSVFAGKEKSWLAIVGWAQKHSLPVPKSWLRQAQNEEKNKEMAEKAKKIAAYKELLKMAKEGSFRDAFDVDCLGPILDIENMNNSKTSARQKKERQICLDTVLCNLALRETDLNDAKSVEEERRVIQLVLTAGANPNTCEQFFSSEEPITVFDAFIHENKYYGALEVAKMKGFIGPQNQAKTFESLASRPSSQDKRELVRVLFNKDMKPYDPKIRKSLQAVYEEEKKARENTSRPTGNVPTGGRSGASR